MKRKNEKHIIVKEGGKVYDIYGISDGLLHPVPKGTIIVKNPLYNPKAAKEYLYFSPNEVEIVYKEQVNNSFFERQKKAQEQSGSESQER